jgi:hypothetical protein
MSAGNDRRTATNGCGDYRRGCRRNPTETSAGGNLKGVNPRTRSSTRSKGFAPAPQARFSPADGCGCGGEDRGEGTPRCCGPLIRPSGTFSPTVKFTWEIKTDCGGEGFVRHVIERMTAARSQSGKKKRRHAPWLSVPPFRFLGIRLGRRPCRPSGGECRGAGARGGLRSLLQ